MIEKQPFRLQEERTKELKSIKYPIHLNKEDIELLELIGKQMREEKMGTVIKNLLNISINMLLKDPVYSSVWELAFKKKRNNERLGIIEPKVDFSQKYKSNW